MMWNDEGQTERDELLEGELWGALFIVVLASAAFVGLGWFIWGWLR